MQYLTGDAMFMGWAPASADFNLVSESENVKKVNFYATKSDASLKFTNGTWDITAITGEITELGKEYPITQIGKEIGTIDVKGCLENNAEYIVTLTFRDNRAYVKIEKGEGVYVPPASYAEKIYFKANENWYNNSKRVSAYFFGGDNDPTWVSMTERSERMYEVDVPKGYSSVIFCSMNSGTTENSWENVHMWNQTSDCSIPAGESSDVVYVYSEGAWNKGSGEWTTLE